MFTKNPHRDTDRPIRLLHLVSTFQIKTDTKWLVQIARHLDRNRFQLHAACFYDDGPIRSQLEELGIPTYNLNIPNERNPLAAWRARQLIRKIHCNVVHTHLLRADLYGGLAARWAGVPLVVSTSYALGEFRREHRRRSDPLLDAASIALPTQLIAVARAVRDDLVERRRIDPRRITVIHTGIDLPPTVAPAAQAAARRELGIEANQPLVVAIARLSYEKGLDTLIDAAPHLARHCRSARIAVIGEGPERHNLETRIRAHDIGDAIRLVGFRADIWPYLAAADVVCMPSHSEGMPNALLEAMALGRPIVATRVGGIPEAITHEQNGLLVEPRRPDELAASIARLLDNRAWAIRLQEVARQTIEEQFLARDAIARYADFYLHQLAARKGGNVVVQAATF